MGLRADVPWLVAGFLVVACGTAAIVRYVHPGPEFRAGGPADHEQCRADFRDIRAAIVTLLSEPA